MKKAYFLVVLFLSGLSVGNVFAAAPTPTWADWARSLFPGAGTTTKGYLTLELTTAIKRGNKMEVERLIKAGADVNPADEGWTPLMEAAIQGHDDIVQQLLDLGANVNAATTFGKLTALMEAASRGYKGKNIENIVELLLGAGAEVNAANQDGNTALMEAVVGGNENIVKQLLDAGAEVNAQQERDSKFTALMWAAIYNNKNAAQLLLDHGADKNIQDNDGKTAEELARDKGHEEIANMIRDYRPSGRLTKGAGRRN